MKSKKNIQSFCGFVVFNFRKVFGGILGVCAAICTALTFWQPAVNAFALMLLVIPTFILLYSALKE